MINDREWEAAVELLLSKIQNETWVSLKKSASVMPGDWARLFNLIVGPALRNLLIAYGFKWGDHSIENNIPFLLEDAMSRVDEDKVYFHATVYFSD